MSVPEACGCPTRVAVAVVVVVVVVLLFVVAAAGGDTAGAKDQRRCSRRRRLCRIQSQLAVLSRSDVDVLVDQLDPEERTAVADIARIQPSSNTQQLTICTKICYTNLVSMQHAADVPVLYLQNQKQIRKSTLFSTAALMCI